MTDLAKGNEQYVKEATEAVIGKDLENLYEELGMRSKAIGVDLTRMGDPVLSVNYDGKLMGPMTEIADLGKRIAKRWIREIHQVVCGNEADDKDDREKLQSLFGLKGSDLATALTAFLVSTFFVASPIAAVVAAIIVKRLGASAMDEFCKKSADWVKQME
jgi:hypothetical protein